MVVAIILVEICEAEKLVRRAVRNNGLGGKTGCIGAAGKAGTATSSRRCRSVHQFFTLARIWPAAFAADFVRNGYYRCPGGVVGFAGTLRQSAAARAAGESDLRWTARIRFGSRVTCWMSASPTSLASGASGSRGLSRARSQRLGHERSSRRSLGAAPASPPFADAFST